MDSASFAPQVLGTASGDGSSSGQNATETPRRSSRGGVTTTAQTRLYPPLPGTDTLLTNPIHDAASNFMELESFGETANVTKSLPVDAGFGAWSYVATAFSMFVVVWGGFLSPAASKSILEQFKD